MTDSHSGASSQATYQVRLAWGSAGLAQLAQSGIVVVVDAIDDPAGGHAARAGEDGDDAGGHTASNSGRTDSTAAQALAAEAAALPHAPTVFIGSLRNATATGRAAYEEQLARGGRTAINLVLVGSGGNVAAGATGGGFAVEDYLAAGAIADTLAALGIDHSAPDAAVANEGFRPLTKALKHLVSASAAGLALAAEGRRDEVKAAAELDADTEAIRFAG